jgi:hypothetical protein
MNPNRSDNGSQIAMDHHVVADETDWQNSVNRNVIGIEPNESTLLVSTGEDPFWSKEQLILIENFPANAFVVMGLIVSIIGIFGLVANGMVLFIFSRYNSITFSLYFPLKLLPALCAPDVICHSCWPLYFISFDCN